MFSSLRRFPRVLGVLCWKWGRPNIQNWVGLRITISHMLRSEIGWEVLKNGTKKRSCTSRDQSEEPQTRSFLTYTTSWFCRFWISPSVQTMGLSVRWSLPSEPLSEMMGRQHLLAESHSQMFNCERGSRVGIAWSKPAFDMVFAFALLS